LETEVDVAAPPRSFPIPRGSLSLSLPEFFTNQLMSAAAQQGAGVGNFPQIGLYNNSTIGSLLYVIGLTVWVQPQNDNCFVFQVNQFPPTFTQSPGYPVNPLFATRDGVLITTATAGGLPGNRVWRLSGNQVPEAWPYERPLAILPPGWTLYVSPDQPNSSISAGFQWLVLLPNQV
jgi:hypothetical protein